MLDATPVDGNADSSTAPTADTSQATTQPAQQNGGQFIPYDRFQQVNSRMHAAEQRALLLEQQIQQQEAQRAQTGQTQPSDEERAAVAALERLMAQHPKMKMLLDNADKFTGVQQSVEQITTQNFNNTLASGDRQIAEFVKANGLPSDPEFVTWFQTQVGALIKAHPQAEQRLRAGDPSVIDEATKAFAKGLTPLRSTAAATLAQTKSTVRNLPPRSAAGTTPGAAAPEPYDPAKQSPQSRWEQAMTRMRQVTSSMAAEG